MTRHRRRVRSRARLASGVVLLVLALSGCGGDTATDEASPEERATPEQSGTAEQAETAEQSGPAEQSAYEQGYQAGYIFCNGQSVRQVAGEFEVSEEPKAAAEGFAASFEPEQRQGAYEGCYDGLLGRPSRVP
jgi:hypothetical protein